MVSCKLRHLLAALVSALMFCAASSGIIMLNKWIISVLGFKFPMTLSLIGMLLYQAHLGLRDTDKSTFEFRVRESLKFIEANHPGYRYYMISMLGIDSFNCTEEQVPNLKDNASIYVQAHSQGAVFSAILILIGSRVGCICAAAHSFFSMVGYNLYAWKDVFLQYVKYAYSDGTPKYRKSSPCLPRNEFKESKLHIDKSDAF